MVRIAIPAGGWKVPDKFMVQEGTVAADGTFTASTTNPTLYDKRTGSRRNLSRTDADNIQRIGFKADAWITVKHNG